MSRLTERMRNRVVTEALAGAVFLGILVVGSALAEEPETRQPGIDAAPQVEMPQDHRGAEYQPELDSLNALDPTALSLWLEQHRAIEHGESLLRLTPRPAEWAGWLHAHRAIEYPDDVDPSLDEAGQQ